MNTLRRRPSPSALALALSLAYAAMPLNTAQAASCTWNSATGNWSVAGNWSCALVPGINDDATIALGKTVTVDTAQSIRSLTNAGSVNIDAFLLTLSGAGGTSNTGTINVGSAVTGALQISAGHNFINTGGLVNIGTGSVVNQGGSTITGGSFAAAAGGRLAPANNNNNHLSGVNFSGLIDLGTALGVERVVNGLTLNGTASIDNGSLMSLQGTQSIAGSGTFIFGATGNNRLGVDGGGAVVTMGPNTVVRGTNGTIGLAVFVNGSGNALVNQGLISSDSGGTIAVSQAGLVNPGIAEATGAGSVLRFDSSVDNTGGTIRAVNGGVVLQNGVTISGGTIAGSGGVLRASNNGNNFLSGVTVGPTGVVDLASALGTLRATGGMTLNGTANIGSSSILSFEGTQTLGGSGTVVFGSGGNNRLGIDGGGQTLTIAPGITVRGENGAIGDGAFINGNGNALINGGLISADVNGGSIALRNLFAGVTNNGTIEARNGGTLRLQANVVGGSGQLLANPGSVVLQEGVTVGATAINTIGSGVFRPTNNGNNFLSNATVNGVLDMTALGSERVINNLSLAGTAQIDNSSILSFQGSQTLSGGGTIVFGNTGNNRVGVDGGGQTLTIAAGTTIRGHTGSIGDGAFINGSGNALVNNGLISADVAGGHINLRSLTAGITNNGTIQAVNGATIHLQSNLTGTASGQLVAGAGSLIAQEGVTVSGVINTSGSGTFRPANNGNNFLSAVTLNGALDMASALGSEQVVGGLVLNGTVSINNSSIISMLNNQTVSGTGSFVFGATGNNRVGVDGGGKTVTFGPGITVRGINGAIGNGVFINGTGNSLINQGLISSDSGGTIAIVQLDNALVNQNIVEATGAGSVLRLDSNVNNAGGTIRAGNGGVVLQNGVTVTGGIITGASGGVYRLANNGNNFLSGVTVAANGVVDMATALGTGRVIGGMTVSGAVNIDQSSLLSFQGTQTLSGTGTFTFGANGSNRLGIDGGGQTLTIGPSITVHGQNGSIGDAVFINGNGNALVNQGTIHSDGGGTITLRQLSGGITNDGLMRAQNGALSVQNALGGTGTLQVDAAGSAALVNGGNAQGRLLMGATGAALNIGTGNLVISNDYTNVGAGTGNAFNRRAGISGTGQVVASGDVAQVISGAQVTGGNTNNATLTIGNVRVGNNTFNYQVGNAGAAGPTLRGALQTAVNGANLNDARLSGSGVTAANYNAGAPGGNSGDLAVVFNAANAGALAPMAGQVLNLRSNFENIPDQKLNIALGAGAAAYNAAVGSATSPVQVGNQRVGGGNGATMVVANTAPAGSFSEDLNVTLGAISGPVGASGGITGRLAGTNNTGTGSITASVNAASAGAKSGTVTLDYHTAGAVNGISNGLGSASAGSQVVTINGNVYAPASGLLVSGPLNFGTVQVGQVVSTNLVVRNNAGGAAGFVEDLDVAFGATSGTGGNLISGSGSLSGITAGNNSTAANGTMTVSVNTSAPGTVAGAIALNYSSAGAVGGVSNGLGSLAVGSENFAVNGTINAVANVINPASPLLNTPSVSFAAVRVGDPAPGAFVSVTNQATTPPQAALNASIAPNGAPVTASGSFTLLNPGQTDATSLRVGLASNVAGNFTGANAGLATIALVSDANNVGNCAPNCQMTLASQSVTVSGKVYTPAVGQVNTPVVDFGIVRVGDNVAPRSISVQNSAAQTALNDTLRANLGGIGGPFSSSGTVGGVAAQGNGQIAISLATANAGVFSQNGSVTLLSQNPDMSDASAGAPGGVQVLAQINNLANADFDLLGGAGTLSQAGTQYVLDLGTIVLGQSRSASLQIDNDVLGPADLLRGLFDLAAADDFQLSGWNPLAGLAAGQAQGGLGVSFDAIALGAFEDTIGFDGFSFNAADPDGIAQRRQLVIRANVVNAGPGNPVPEPSVLALLLAAALSAWLARRRRTALH